MDLNYINMTEEEKLELYQRKLNDVYIDGEKSSVEDNELKSLRIKLGLPEGKCQVLEERFFDKLEEEKSLIAPKEGKELVQDFKDNIQEHIFNDIKNVDTMLIASKLIKEMTSEEKEKLDKELCLQGITNETSLKKKLLDWKREIPEHKTIETVLLKIKDAIVDNNFPLGQETEKLDYYVDKQNIPLSGINQLILHSSANLNLEEGKQKTKTIEYSDYIENNNEISDEVKKSASIVMDGLDLNILIPIENDKEQLPLHLKKQQTPGTSFEARLKRDLNNYFISMFNKEPYKPETLWNNPLWSEQLNKYIREKPLRFINLVNKQISPMYAQVKKQILEKDMKKQDEYSRSR